MGRRVLFVVFPEPGHLHPVLGVAQRLERDGHTLAFFAQEDVSARLRRAGLAARCDSVAGEATPGRSGRTQALAARARDPRWLRRWYELTMLEVVPPQVRALAGVLSDFRPDVVCTDPLNYAGAVAAERAGVPWAALATNLLGVVPLDWRCPLTDALAELGPERERALEGTRVTFRGAEAASPFLEVVFSTEAFTPRALSGNATAHLVGPSFPLGARGDEAPFPWERLRPERPIVYVSFGGGRQLSFAPELLARLAGALDPGEAQVVLALGDLAHEPFVDALPPHVVAVEFAPQPALLGRADLFVTHGGANSVMEALARGRPMLVCPLAHEQPLQARLVEHAGVGIARAPDLLLHDDLRALLRGLLAADAPCRARAQAIGRSYAEQDGAQRAAELILEVATTRAPVRPA